ncbi:MAG TPA: hypothetical protein VNS58_18285 [Puia sp.]|nr:hypothetical protein [Puia sp.]
MLNLSRWTKVILLVALAGCKNPVSYPPGGYPYPDPATVKDTNFYYYPLKNKLSRRDSFRCSSDSCYFHAFHEPNLSIHALPTAYFRLTYGGPLRSPIIITLTPYEIVVKKGQLTEEYVSLPDTNRLSVIERRHLRLLDRYYPIDEKQHRPVWKLHYLDSMGHIYPQLYDPAYYAGLQGRAYAHTAPIYSFTVKQIKISQLTYDSLVNHINASGYWQLPYAVECKDPPFDVPGFSMEANTPDKYNCVNTSLCDDSPPRYMSACQELIRQAGLGKEIHLAWDPKMDTVKSKSIIVQDVQLEEVKEPKKPKRQHH